MPRATTTAKFPTSVVALADIGLFTNDEAAILGAAITSGAVTADVDDASTFAIGMWVPIRGVNGLEVCQVTAVDLGLNRLTLTRAKDGTVAIAHSQGEVFKASVPAIALNQMRDEIIAMETLLYPGEAWVAGSVVFVGAGGTNFEQDNANFYWDDANNRLGIAAAASPQFTLDVGGIVRIRSANRLTWGGTGAADNDVGIGRQAASILELTGSLAGSVRAGMSGAATPFIELRLAAADAQPAAQLLKDRVGFGAGSAAALDVFLTRDRDSVFSVLGALAGNVRFGNTTAGNAFLSLRAAAADANPYTLLDATGLNFGAGGATAVDVRVYRGAANRFDVATGDSVSLVSGNLSVGTATLGGSANNVFGLFLATAPTSSPADTVQVYAEDESAGAAAFTVRTENSSILKFGGANGITTVTSSPTDATQKSFRFGVIHYTIAEEPLMLLFGQSDVAASTVRVGGGSGLLNAATQVSLYAAATTTTVTGTEIVRVTTAGANVLNGDFLIGSTIVFEADRDLAVSLIPNADNTLNLGSSARRFATAYAQAHDVLNAVSDANPLYRLGSLGFVAGAGGASVTDVALARQAASVLQVTGSLAGSVRFGMSGAATPFLALRAAAADAQPTAQILSASLAFGAGGASALDTYAFRQAAGVVAASTDGAAVDGTFFARTLKLDNQGAGADPTLTSNSGLQTFTLGGNIFPDGDNTRSIGNSTVRLANVVSVVFDAYAASADANPAVRVTSAGVRWGVGGATATDILAARQAASVLELTGSLAGSVRYGMSGANTPFVELRNAAADANPATQILKASIGFGAGAASALDVFIDRQAGAANQHIHFGAAVGGVTGVWVDTDTPGLILKDSSNNYWRVTIDTTGNLTTTSLGASLP